MKKRRIFNKKEEKEEKKRKTRCSHIFQTLGTWQGKKLIWKTTSKERKKNKRERDKKKTPEIKMLKKINRQDFAIHNPYLADLDTKDERHMKK